MTNSGADEARDWRAIETAPRDGQFVLLCAPGAKELRLSSAISDQHVYGHYGLVGRWCHSPPCGSAQWVSDLRSLDCTADEAIWISDRFEPTHWMPLPLPPPSPGWCETLVSLPPLKTFALLFDPLVHTLRGSPMDLRAEGAPESNMVMGCLVDEQPDFLPQWVTDLSEESLDPAFPENIMSEQIILMAPYWYELPQEPVA